MHLKKRQLLKTLAAGLTVPYLPASQAQNARYPNKAVSIEPLAKLPRLLLTIITA